MDLSTTVQSVYAKILKFLVVKPRTAVEVSTKIDSYKKFLNDLPESDFEIVKSKVISMLMDTKYIDDTKYARDFLESMNISTKAQSPIKIKQYLLRKQLPNDLANSITSGINDETKLSWATKIATTKLRSYGKYPYSERKRRLGVFLYSKGFSWEIITLAVDIALGVK